MTIFVLTKQSGPFLDPFLVQNLAIFAQKSGFRMRTSDLSETWSETWDSCIESLKGSFVSRIILVILLIIYCF